jgi:hypothetical protein
MLAREPRPVVPTNDPVAPSKAAAKLDGRDQTVDLPTTPQRVSEKPSQPQAPPPRKDDDKAQIAAATSRPAPRSDAVDPAPPAVAVSPREEKTQPLSSTNNSKTPVAPATATATSAATRGPTPSEDALKTRGLTKRDTLYVLDTEREFLSGFAELEPLYGELTKLYSTAAPIVQSLEAYNMADRRYAFLLLEWKNVGAEKRTFPPGNNNVLNQEWQNLLDYEKGLRIELNTLDEQLNFMWKNLMPEPQRRNLFAKFQETQAKFLRESKSLRALGDKISARYAELRKDDTVKSAIRELGLSTKTRIDLGPSREFHNKRTLLKNAERKFSAATVSRKLTRPRAAQKAKAL